MTVRKRMVSGRALATQAGAALAYALVAKVGFALGAADFVSPVYPAAGLAVALLFLLGLNLWPSVLAGTVLVHAGTDVELLFSLQIGAATASAAFIGASVLRRTVDAARPFERLGDTIALVAVAAVGSAVAATGGVAALWAGGHLGDGRVAEGWAVWALGDAAGILAIAPLVIVLARHRPRLSRWDLLHAAGLIGAATAATLLVFGPWFERHSRLYLLFPFVVWAALYRGTQAVVVVGAAVSLAASWATIHGLGPLSGIEDKSNLVLLDGFIAALIVTGLVLAALDGQRRRAVAASEALLEAERGSRQEAEYASQRTNEILETIADAFVSLDRDWVVVYANDEALRLGRVGPDEAIGRRYWDVVPAVVGTAFERRFREAMGTKQPAHFDAEIPRLGLWLDVHVYPTAERLSIYFRDITRNRRLEQELALSRKMEVVGRMAGGVAHDFNNLLLAIRGYGELALRRLDRHDEGAAADVGEMLKAAERGADLTRQLLAVGRRQPLNAEVIDLNASLSHIEPLLRRVIGEDIDLQFDRPPEPVYIHADRSQIEQVVLNLAVNARDAMPTGGRLAILVALPENGSDEIPGGRLRLRVSDTGVGMAPETASQVFEPFFTTKGDGGTGLGLATVHGIVTQMGGHIELHTEPGKGTCFDIFLPLTSERPRRALPPPTRTRGGNETVLVVEDDPSVRLITTRLLEDRGYIAVAASRGEEAVRLARRPSLRIDLVLSDVVMPDLNGMQTAQQIRSIQPHVRVLLMSGYTNEHTGSSGTLAPGMSYIQKPFSGDQLARKIRELLDEAEHQG